MFSLKDVLITDPVNPVCVEILKTNNINVVYKPKLPTPQILEEIQNYDGLIVRSGTKVTEDILNAGKKLKIVGRAGTGVDNIDCAAATRRGIVVMNTPGGNTMSAAEHTCAMILSLLRDIPRATASLKAKEWERTKFMGNEALGKTLAIIGLGRIGREVAFRMQAFGMKTIGYDPIVSKEEAAEFGVEAMTLDEIWPKADIITVHTPLIPETKHLINSNAFDRCKKGVRVVNVARGGIIDENALLLALETGRCGGAALDVFDQEPPVNYRLLEHPSVICTPHLGANTHEAQTRVAMEIAEQFVGFSTGQNLIGMVNAPTLAASLLPENRPWVKLGENLGKIITALASHKWSNDVVISCTAIGVKLEPLRALLVNSVLTGVVGCLTRNGTNLINAPSLALENGIKVCSKSEKSTDVEGVLLVGVETNDFRLRISATLYGKIPILNAIDDVTFPGGVSLSNRLLFFRSENSSNVRENALLLGEKVPIIAVHFSHPQPNWMIQKTLDIDTKLEAKKYLLADVVL